MRISTRGEYGVRAMLDLALRYEEGPTALRAVAEREKISEFYLEQLMRALRQAGLVKTARGAQGGYSLARPPEEIKMGQIMRAVEGPIAPAECVNGEGKDVCVQAPHCVTRLLWARLRDSMLSVLDTTTLEDLRRQAREILDGRGSARGIGQEQ